MPAYHKVEFKRKVEVLSNQLLDIQANESRYKPHLYYGLFCELIGELPMQWNTQIQRLCKVGLERVTLKDLSDALTSDIEAAGFSNERTEVLHPLLRLLLNMRSAEIMQPPTNSGSRNAYRGI